MAEVNLFLIFIASIFFDLLIGDPEFIIHPVQIIGTYVEKFSNIFIYNFRENKSILFWGGLLIALSTIAISFSFGKIIELNYFQSKNSFLGTLFIFFGLSSCIASKGLTSSVKDILNFLEHEEINDENETVLKAKVQKIVSRDVSSSSY